MGVVPLLTLGQGIGGGGAGDGCKCMGRPSAAPPQGMYMYVHHKIIGAAHVSVNINGRCTDACANVARAWQALHVLRVTGLVAFMPALPACCGQLCFTIAHSSSPNDEK